MTLNHYEKFVENSKKYLCNPGYPYLWLYTDVKDSVLLIRGMDFGGDAESPLIPRVKEFKDAAAAAQVAKRIEELIQEINRLMR